MRRVQRHKLPLDCACGHPWDDHHHGCVLNPKSPIDDHAQGICQGLMAEECERFQVNGVSTGDGFCDCRYYRPCQKSQRT